MSQLAFNEMLFAPCGMNCAVCYKHLAKKPCSGCLWGDSAKPGHCQTCRIKDCVSKKGIGYCLHCSLFPCGLIKALDKSYQTRYGTSLIANSLLVKEQGTAAFMAQQRKLYTCSDCGGIISLHDGICSCCGAEYPLERRLNAL